jgi:5-formyltetrahydrofolate cyclo-ligase
MDKQAARNLYGANLARLSDEQRSALMVDLARVVTNLPEWRVAKSVALTMAQPTELPTQLLIQTALQQGKAVYLPRVLPKHQMQFVQITAETEYEKHPFGMLEPISGDAILPSAIDFMLVPGLAFAADGQRLGFGGGYYDRYLPAVTGVTVGVTLPTHYLDVGDWPVEPTDVPVSRVLTIGEGI